MPKIQKSRAPRPYSSTDQKRARAVRVEQEGLEMDFRCKRCEEKKLRCFVETSSGRCAGCISVGAECSLFVSEEEWRRVQRERRERELEVAELKARLAQSEVELLRVKNREHSFARRDLAVLDFQEKATQKAEGSTAPGTDLPAIEPPLSEPSADLGWLQAELDLLDPSLDLSFLLGDLVPAASDAFGGTPVPIPCSS